jgi:glucosyl-3-phosphoglycerate synthase
MFNMLKTFHHSEFKEKGPLLSAKQSAGKTISVILPARNEATTIGKIISEIKKELVDTVQLVDEIVVIDGYSSDDTARVARDAGATVHRIDTAGPSLSYSGKGASLWKSQFVTKGDILVFIDADIMDFDCRFIYGLIGPLLCFDDVCFIKAFYRRPLLLKGVYYENYGGRVTELLVRPILCSIVPELAGFHQPLAGEFAIRRPVLETLSLSSGYGVEIGMLFDLYTNYGLSKCAQVDMECRCHRNRSVNELGKTAFAVLHTLFSRLEHLGYVSFEKALSSTLFFPLGREWEETELKETDLVPKCQLTQGE